jgi:hypothetical protein
MKKIIILIIVLFGGIYVSYAQIDRRVGQGQYKPAEGPKIDYDKEIKNQTLTFFIDKVGVDGFQEAVIKVNVEDLQRQIKEITESNLSILEKNELMQQKHEKFRLEVKKILTEEQWGKYEELTAIKPKKKKN